jgi:hypothetical protein
MGSIMKIFLGCSKGEYKRREEDEVGENIQVICPNTVYDLQTAFCLMDSPVYIFGIWPILDHSALHYSPFHIFPLIWCNDKYSALLLAWEWTKTP